LPRLRQSRLSPAMDTLCPRNLDGMIELVGINIEQCEKFLSEYTKLTVSIFGKPSLEFHSNNSNMQA
ncbi:hypothetical protein, partial [Sphingobium yanoikuyae]|uniref:hypothetical protein n=1 Tax=Sphingobium yanoikuyae TaxID=13690 RepID=UPI001BDE55EA